MGGVKLISEARLGTYKEFTNNAEKAMELHNMTMQVGSSLLAVIALIELGLRNLADKQIAKDFGEQDWLLTQPSGLKFHSTEKNTIKAAIKHAQKAQYAKLSYKDKNALDANIYPHGVPTNIRHETLSRKRIETFSVTQGQIIAQTTIFFWKRLFSPEYEASLWKRSLKKIFPQKHIKRSDVSTHLESLYSARNRIAHHDPVYGDRLDRAFESTKYLRENFGRRKGDLESEFLKFTEIQFHRFYIDFIAFKNVWSLLEDGHT